MHEHGVVHRDLKPENILLTSDDHCKISFFFFFIILKFPSFALCTSPILVSPTSLPTCTVQTKTPRSRTRPLQLQKQPLLCLVNWRSLPVQFLSDRTPSSKKSTRTTSTDWVLTIATAITISCIAICLDKRVIMKTPPLTISFWTVRRRRGEPTNTITTCHCCESLSPCRKSPKQWMETLRTLPAQCTTCPQKFAVEKSTILLRLIYLFQILSSLSLSFTLSHLVRWSDALRDGFWNSAYLDW